MRLRTRYITAVVVALLCLWTSSCGRARENGTDNHNVDSTLVSSEEKHQLPDTLRVGTLYSPTSYFIYRETEMGFDYDLVKRLGQDKGMAVEFILANNLGRAIELLDSGKIDLLAYEVPVTAEYLERVVPCGVENVTHQVLVQPKKDDGSMVTDVTQLVGREIFVEKDSKYYFRMQNLNEELGGGITIKDVKRDTLITEDLIAMVSDGEIPLTVVDSDIAQLNQTYFLQIDVSVEVSFPQRSAWAVSPRNKWLADTINEWADRESLTVERASLLKRYYERSKQAVGEEIDIDFSTGRMSPYDALFKRHAATLGWDWRLLSSVAFVESHYDASQVSWAGARGIMQLMPSTAKGYGLTMDRITDNDACIATAVKVFQSLDDTMKKYVSNPKERIKFILAGYNSGPAHILDAIAIAKKVGTPPDVWDGSVADALMLKTNPEFYNAPGVKYGYFNGRQTYDYVHKVMDCYETAKKHIAL